MNLTDNEKKVLAALFASSAGNSHDFGFIDEARGALPSPRSLAGVVASLVKKNIIAVEDFTTVDGTQAQFTLLAGTRPLQDVNELEDDDRAKRLDAIRAMFAGAAQ